MTSCIWVVARENEFASGLLVASCLFLLFHPVCCHGHALYSDVRHSETETCCYRKINYGVVISGVVMSGVVISGVFMWPSD